MGWIKLHRGNADRLALLLRHPRALALLTLLALRARFRAGLDPATGLELKVGEALTGRGDADLIGASPRQYRVCKDQLIKWGFVATSRATKGATWGTVLKIVDSSVYEIVQLDDDHVSGQVNDNLATSKGPPDDHEHRRYRRCRSEEEPPPTTPGELPAGAGPGGGKVDDFKDLAAKLADLEIKNGKKIRHLEAYQAKIVARLISQGGPNQEERQALGLVDKQAAAEITNKNEVLAQMESHILSQKSQAEFLADMEKRRSCGLLSEAAYLRTMKSLGLDPKKSNENEALPEEEDWENIVLSVNDALGGLQ